MTEHPEIEYLTLNGCEKLQDLSVLTEMPKLEKVTLSGYGRSLIRTLDGYEYDFELLLQ